MARGDRRPLSDVLEAIESGQAHLWPGERSAAVCERVTTYHVWLAGGDLRELQAMERAAEAWARGNGCDRMSIIGRKGWARALAGYEPGLIKRF